MSLATIETTLVAAAQAEWAKIKAEGIVIEQEIVSDAESTFETVVTQFGPLAMTTISNLATAEFTGLSGSEKTNLATTTVVQGAAAQGVALLAEDATALIKNAFEAFKNEAPTIVPAGLATAAGEALAAGETAVEGAIETAASDVTAKI